MSSLDYLRGKEIKGLDKERDVDIEERLKPKGG